MTNSNNDTLKIESVPVPDDYRMKRESLPENVAEVLLQMEVGQSFFLSTDDKEHTARKSRALRSRVTRLQNEHPELRFSIRHETKDGKTGVRVYRVEDEYASQ